VTRVWALGEFTPARKPSKRCRVFGGLIGLHCAPLFTGLDFSEVARRVLSGESFGELAFKTAQL
jgi:hypothetical protein